MDRLTENVIVDRRGVEVEENFRKRLEFSNVVSKSEITFKRLLESCCMLKEQELLLSSKGLDDPLVVQN